MEVVRHCQDSRQMHTNDADALGRVIIVCLWGEIYVYGYNVQRRFGEMEEGFVVQL